MPVKFEKRLIADERYESAGVFDLVASYPEGIAALAQQPPVLPEHLTSEEDSARLHPRARRRGEHRRRCRELTVASIARAGPFIRHGASSSPEARSAVLRLQVRVSGRTCRPETLVGLSCRGRAAI